MKKILLTISILFAVFSSSLSQTINLHFPHFAGVSYVYYLIQGEKCDTILRGTIPQDGKLQLVIPEKYKDYSGMTRWMLTSAPGGGLDLIVNGESFSVECLDKSPTEQSIKYSNSLENIYVNQQYKRQQAIFQKIDAMKMASQAFSKQDTLYPVFIKELSYQEKLYDAFFNERSNNNLYAARFAEIVDITRGIGDKIYKTELEKTVAVEKFITNKMDWAALYTSNHWEMVIYSWMQMHLNVMKNDSVFATHTKTILSRLTDNKMYSDFAVYLIKALTKQGKDEVLAEMIESIKTDRLINPPANIRILLSKTRLIIGKKAPDLVITEINENRKGTKTLLAANKLSKKYSLILFYESNCGHCDNAMKELIAEYKLLKNKSIRIISISSDIDKQIFTNSSKPYLWPDNYCDLDGIHGVNFKNYGVIGTPTLFVLDNKGIIVLKPTTIDEFMKWVRK